MYFSYLEVKYFSSIRGLKELFLHLSGRFGACALRRFAEEMS